MITSIGLPSVARASTFHIILIKGFYSSLAFWLIDSNTNVVHLNWFYLWIPVEDVSPGIDFVGNSVTVGAVVEIFYFLTDSST